MKKLSIIVPVYNVENWLSRCASSLINQDLDKSEYEIIFVNDGSTDDSFEIAKKYSESYDNIILISQENKGLSAARNAGINKANGKYIWFVDSDDWIEPNIAGQLLKEAEDCGLDVLCFGLNIAFEDGRSNSFGIKNGTDSKVLRGDIFVLKVGMPPAAWCALYRTEYIKKNSLYFMEGVLHEDQEFTPRAYVLAERIKYIPIRAYNYFQRAGSIMKSDRTSKRASDLLKISDSLYAFLLANQDLNTLAKAWILDNIAFIYSQSLAYSSKVKGPIEVYKNKPYYPLKLSSNIRGFNKLKYQIINISISLYRKIYRLQQVFK
ncbi:glycosyltransferase [Bacteroides acidifaciens]|uniref:glycosyltransferase n=1 Tax=Bacteroides acidifaciens TaxID=85831 RepID=UPI0025A5DB87|nr:glycosyltransferase [Bacteroides acidifaciens]